MTHKVRVDTFQISQSHSLALEGWQNVIAFGAAWALPESLLLGESCLDGHLQQMVLSQSFDPIPVDRPRAVLSPMVISCFV